MSKFFFSKNQPLNDEPGLSLSDKELFYRAFYIHNYGCASILNKLRENITDLELLKKLILKRTACMLSFMSGSAQQCFAEIDVTSDDVSNEEEMERIRKCLQQNQTFDKLLHRISNLRNNNNFLHKYENLMNDKKIEFGDENNADIQKWQHHGICDGEIRKYKNCVAQLSKQHNASKEEIEEAITNGESFECFMEQKEYNLCLASSFCRDTIQRCMDDPNGSKKFGACVMFGPEVNACVDMIKTKLIQELE